MLLGKKEILGCICMCLYTTYRDQVSNLAHKAFDGMMSHFPRFIEMVRE